MPFPPHIRTGLVCGGGFVLLGAVFVAVSLFTDVPRELWLRLNFAKGAAGFALCAVGGAAIGWRGGTLRQATAAGALAGAMAGVLVPLLIWVLAYGALERVRQFPFEYHSMQTAGAATAQEYLRSPRGRDTVFETTIGLIPIVAVWATLQAGLLAAAAGWAAQRLRARTTRPAPAAG